MTTATEKKAAATMTERGKGGDDCSHRKGNGNGNDNSGEKTGRNGGQAAGNDVPTGADADAGQGGLKNGIDKLEIEKNLTEKMEIK
jgi:hypothetical protein